MAPTTKFNSASVTVAIIVTAATIVSTVALYNIRRQKQRDDDEDDDKQETDNHEVIVEELPTPIITKVDSHDSSDNHPVGMPLDGDISSPSPSPVLVSKTRSVTNIVSYKEDTNGTDKVAVTTTLSSPLEEMKEPVIIPTSNVPDGTKSIEDHINTCTETSTISSVDNTKGDEVLNKADSVDDEGIFLGDVEEKGNTVLPSTPSKSERSANDNAAAEEKHSDEVENPTIVEGGEVPTNNKSTASTRSSGTPTKKRNRRRQNKTKNSPTKTANNTSTSPSKSTKKDNNSNTNVPNKAKVESGNVSESTTTSKNESATEQVVKKTTMPSPRNKKSNGNRNRKNNRNGKNSTPTTPDASLQKVVTGVINQVIDKTQKDVASAAKPPDNRAGNGNTAVKEIGPASPSSTTSSSPMTPKTDAKPSETVTNNSNTATSSSTTQAKKKRRNRRNTKNKNSTTSSTSQTN